MMAGKSSGVVWASVVRGLLVGVLCVSLAGEPAVWAAGAVGATNRTVPAMTADGRALHALNRLTFGPRPGDVAAVKAMGLDRWFERQLDPGSIDDSALETRLAAFPAMGMPQEEMMKRYPGPQVIRAIARDGMPLPDDPVEHAIYADGIAFYRMKEKAKAVPDAGAGGAGIGLGMAGGREAGQAPGATAQAKDETEMPDWMKNGPEQRGPMYPEAERVLALAPDAQFRALVAMSPEELVAFRRSLSKRELAAVLAGMNPWQREVLGAMAGSLKMIGAETVETRLLRDIYSDRQVEAVMTDFWLNHFNVYMKKSQLEPFLIPAFERETIRPRALGRFEDLLVATAKSPAMMVYLDNWRSTGPNSDGARRAAQRQERQSLKADTTKGAKAAEGLNENYARELMELHTLGVGGGYTQADVTQVAKVFTGWTVDQPYREGAFQFDQRRHEPGAKTVLGRRIGEDGQAEGLEVLHLLATSPATARFVSTKLAVRFVSDDPSPALVDRMTAAWTASGGDMRTVLRAMFHAPEFWAPEVEHAKVKTPLEFVVSAVRASGAEVSDARPLAQALDKLGMPLYGMQTPNGYSWKKADWVSTGALVSRMNFALLLSGGGIAGTRTEWSLLPRAAGGGVQRVATVRAVVPDSAETAKERALETMLLGGPASERTRATVLAQFDDAGMKESAAKEFDVGGDAGTGGGGYGGGERAGKRLDARAAVADPQVAGMAGLLLGSPEFQRR